MRYAVPLAKGVLCAHFGHCEEFALLDVDEAGRISSVRTAQPPPHEPGALPEWLRKEGVGVVIAGGMGRRAQDLFAQDGIRVAVGAPAATPEELVRAHLAGTLQTGENVCDH